MIKSGTSCTPESDTLTKRVQWQISVGPACRAGLRGHAATSDESRSKGQPSGDGERMCDPWRFALRRKSFPAERTYQSQSFPAERTYQSQSFPAERTYFDNHSRLHSHESGIGQFQPDEKPPSTYSVWPVMNADAFAARKMAVPIISSG